MSAANIQAQPPLEFIPPQLNPLFLRITHLFLPVWIRTQSAIAQIEADNVEKLVDLMHDFQGGKIRLLIAFRHPQVDDPLCLGYLLHRLVPNVAASMGKPLKFPVHAHCMYDRGIPLWAGSHIGWMISRLGGTPIQRGKADWVGLKTARNLFLNGRFPMAAAPEGGTNGLNEIISPLEPGIAQMGFWCAQDLQKAQRQEQVIILPVGIQYSYIDPPWDAIAKLLSELETASGLPKSSQFSSSDLDVLYTRLIRLSERLLSLMEDFYKRFYHQELPTVSTYVNNSDSNSDNDSGILSSYTEETNEAIKIRLQALLDAALKVSEAYFHLPPKGNLNDRCRRVEQAGWNYIYREDFKDIGDINNLSLVERSLADKVAEEATSRMWHMRLVENFVAVSGKYVREKPTAERFSQTLLIIWQIVQRIQNQDSFERPSLGRQKANLVVGEPIAVSERYEEYQSSRKNARKAVADLTDDLQKAMEKLIIC
ncbi:MAG: 1-acyl-sn-glycerol-3-phosphate acyltransferase [Cyanobacteria bacterium P01_A01_bin.45]